MSKLNCKLITPNEKHIPRKDISLQTVIISFMLGGGGGDDKNETYPDKVSKELQFFGSKTIDFS